MIRAHKSLKAARALIGAQAGVYAHVVLQVIVVSKGSATLRAQVRLFSCMLPHVDLELVLPVWENTSEKEIKTRTQKMSSRGWALVVCHVHGARTLVAAVFR